MKRPAALLALALLGAPGTSDAAGMYFTDRGVRPMGRAGAFVAGADDLGAIWYNPGGLSDAGSSLLVDFSVLRFQSRYDRELLIADAADTLQTVRSPRVEGSSEILPLPTLAGAYSRGKLSVAAGLYSPYLALPRYAPTVGGQPSPARYTLGSFAGSRVGLPGVWVAYRPTDWISGGLGVQALVGTLESTLTFSVSPQDRLIGAPEQPDYDAASKVTMGTMVAPSVSGGVVITPHPKLRLGVSGQTPTHVDTDARITVRLPQSAVFDRASVHGDRARVTFDLPGILRAGVEVRPIRRLRVEATYVRELWSVHDAIRASPQGITLDGLVGAPPSLALPKIDTPRNFQDASSYRLGGEYSFDVLRRAVDVRAGLGYEESAVPRAYLSLSSMDFDKTTLTLGASVHLDGFRFDVLYGHVMVADAYVAPADARIPRVSALAGNAPLEAVNGGHYAADSDLVGLGMEYQFR